ncbi:MAG: succinylglutamate desuccinylase/aspartoacylase family protein [Oligoflexia bacterium]|nr:succinylglutamate desuccinylase/aspartoacylase family protein [Oligoflexia bacterium]
MKLNLVILFSISCLLYLCPLLLYASEHQYQLSKASTISASDRPDLNQLSRFASIDQVHGNSLTLYISSKNIKKLQQFLRTHPTYTLSISKQMAIAVEEQQMTNELNGKWNAYPTYSAYESFMKSMATQYPSLCQLIDFGITTKKHHLYALRITQNANSNSSSSKPKFLLTGAVHGDELVGSIISLQMIEYLLSNYQTSTRVQNILNSSEIWINPIFNPDGTYARGDQSVSGATRFNGNYVDLNRNFPDPESGDHPDEESWQPETLAMMKFLEQHNFLFALDFHGGAEVVNYPWDTFARLHADNEWYRSISRLYADTIHARFPDSYYMSDYEDGITNGYAWYEIDGGRPDYLNFTHHSRALTIELSSMKTPPASTLPQYFPLNLESLLLMFEQSLNGFRGKISPAAAKFELIGHDFDGSFIYADKSDGHYLRPLLPGEYTIKVSAEGYQDVVLEKISLGANQSYELNLNLSPK